MAELKDKVENALNEDRTLVLGVQVLLGFQYQAVFQSGFDRLTLAAHYLHLAGLGCLLVSLAGLMAPAPFHRLVTRGNMTPGLLGYTTRSVGLSLLPLSLGLALDFYVVAERLGGALLGGVAAGLAFGLALLCWYVWELLDRSRSASKKVERR